MLTKMRDQMKRNNNQKGFTLVELMVVVVIIGILSAIAVPVYNSVTTKAERGAVEANLRTIDGAIMMYYAGETPAAGTNIPAALVAADITATGKLIPNYLASVPKGPGTASYSITGTAPSQRATVTSTAAVGGSTFTTAVTLDGLKDSTGTYKW